MLYALRKIKNIASLRIYFVCSYGYADKNQEHSKR